MSGKFMKVKRIIIPTITAVIIASQLAGCAAMTSSELLQAINRGDQIEIEIVDPAFAEAEQGQESSIQWIELGNLETNKELRDAWDDLLLITKTADGKNGILYVNNKGEHTINNTLHMVLHNREFQKYLETEDGRLSLADGAFANYADIEAEEEAKALNMAIFGYFNLLPDNTPNYSNADSTLARNEFMAMVFRADTPVQEIEADETFASTVGKSDYNIYAQGVAKDSYLDIESKSLNNMTSNGSITRAEVIYTLVSRYFADELAAVDLKTSKVTFSDAKDGGDIARKEKFIEKDNFKTYWKSYELTYAIQNPDKGLPTDLYKALVVANERGLISSETRWDEACTKAEAVDLLTSAMIKDDSIPVYSYKQGEISGYEVNTNTEEDDLANFEIIDPNFNGAGHEGELQETVQSYITYEDIEPTTMYVISNTTGERYSTYHDPNVSEGELVASGLVDANQELQIDGKATYNGVDYYRLSFQPEMMLNHQIIIPADLVTDKLQEVEVQQPTETQKPVETEKPVEQQPEVQQPTQQPEQTPPPAENNTPEWTPDTGVSKEDWDAFFGGNTTGQQNWTPDHGNGATQDSNGNWVGDVGLTPEELEKLGHMTVH